MLSFLSLIRKFMFLLSCADHYLGIMLQKCICWYYEYLFIKHTPVLCVQYRIIYLNTGDTRNYINVSFIDSRVIHQSCINNCMKRAETKLPFYDWQCIWYCTFSLLYRISSTYFTIFANKTDGPVSWLCLMLWLVLFGSHPHIRLKW
jgi:hypothetical protein